MNKFSQALSISMLSLILLASVLATADAKTETYCGSIPLQSTDWNSSVTLPKFDPALGTLNEVNIDCGLNLSEGIQAENFNNNSIKYTANISGGFLLELPGSEKLSMIFNRSSNGSLEGFDGNMDYSGPSGTNTSMSIPSEHADINVTSIEDFVAGVPDENITLPASAFASSLLSAPGSTSIGVSMKAGVDVCVRYSYNPTAIGQGVSQ